MNVKPLKSIVEETYAKWSEDNGTEMAAALAYYATFSIAPLVMISIAVAGLIFGREAAQGQILGQLQILAGSDGARAVEQMLVNASRPGSGVAAGVTGLIALLIGASGVMGQLQSAMNRIWDVSASAVGDGIKGVIRHRLLSFTMVLGVGFLLLVSLIASAALSALGTYMGDRLPFGETALQILNLLLSFGVITFLFMLIFRYVPDAHVPWRDVWQGAAFTALLFALGKQALGLYLGKSAVASSYGAAGSLVVVLVWVYYSAQILFMGAELTHVLATRRFVKRLEARATADRRLVDRRNHSERRHKTPTLVPIR